MNRYFCTLLLSLFSHLALGQEELRLWPDAAPGSEYWEFSETVTTAANGDRVVANVRDPTLTVFLPDASVANGAAVVIAPGGALRVLGIDNEGLKVAQWLNARGIAAFMLKYRTLQSDPEAAPRAGPAPGMAAAGRTELVIRNANANPAPDDAALSEVRDMGIADMQQALRLVHANAERWNIDTARVGAMGFSAGGGIAIGAALAARSDAAPDFLVSLYGPSLMDVNAGADAPPLFIAVGSTHFNVTNGCLALFAAWKAAGAPAELHVYDGVSGGFGMTARGQPVDAWIERLHEWLIARAIVAK